ELGGWKSPMTDEGFGALRGLPRLRAVNSWWSQRITDAGVADTLASCPMLEDASFGGTRIGDATIEALAGSPNVWRVVGGAGVAGAGRAQLHLIPRLRTRHGADRADSAI